MTTSRRIAARACISAVLAVGISLAACGKESDEATPGGAPRASTANAQGAAVFKMHCAVCHGDSGKGDGIGATALPIKPRDLTSEPYKFVDLAGSASEVEALEKYIKAGKLDSGMPAFGAVLNAADLRAVAEHVRSLRPQATGG